VGTARSAKHDGVDSKPSASWANLVAQGDFADVVEAAEQMGIPQALGTNSAADLQALAQAARYSGRTGLAQRAWRTLRERFAGQTQGRQAAFFLGRSYDQQGQPSEALRWLNTYLREAPSGVYAAEALGRKLTLVQRLKGRSAAAGLARNYLKRFPDGAYAQTARGIVRQE
jgi:TolA-binding protein